MAQTFWDVRHTQADRDERVRGLYCNLSPLRRPQAEKMAASLRDAGGDVEIVPTRDELWERTYGDGQVLLPSCPASLVGEPSAANYANAKAADRPETT